MTALAGIVILGILAQWVAWKFKIPAILPLILIGLLVGPISTLFTVDGSKLIEPIWNGTEGLFPGESLFYFVSLAISIILFEGGLTLRKDEVLNVGPVIVKLITLAVVVTFVGAGFAAHYIFGLSFPISFLFSALIIVTGPTVITPILRNIPLKKDISAILKWEGILIDPIGALVAVLVFEFISVGEGGQSFTVTALSEFAKIILFGFTFGFTFAHFLVFTIKRKIVPHYLLNVFTLASVLGVFVLSDFFAHESGLLSVVIKGMVLGNKQLPNLKELLYFKESLSVLLISILFILLSANIEIEELLLVYNWQALALFATVVFIVRPIGVFLSTRNSGLKTNEKLFISWVGPRGIVAAGIASLFGLKLAAQGEPGAEYITPLVFMIVLGTVLLNATTARLVARLIGVFLKKSDGILMVGASEISRVIGSYLAQNGRNVVLIDTNKSNIELAKSQGVQAIQTNIYDDQLENNIELNDIGFLMALTANDDINKYAIGKFKEQFGENGSFRLITSAEMEDNTNNPVEGLFSHTDDYESLGRIVKKHPVMTEIVLESKHHFKQLITRTQKNKDCIPIFVKDIANELHIVSANMEDHSCIEKGASLVCLGDKIAN